MSDQIVRKETNLRGSFLPSLTSPKRAKNIKYVSLTLSSRPLLPFLRVHGSSELKLGGGGGGRVYYAAICHRAKRKLHFLFVSLRRRRVAAHYTLHNARAKRKRKFLMFGQYRKWHENTGEGGIRKRKLKGGKLKISKCGTFEIIPSIYVYVT